MTKRIAQKTLVRLYDLPGPTVWRRTGKRRGSNWRVICAAVRRLPTDGIAVALREAMSGLPSGHGMMPEPGRRS